MKTSFLVALSITALVQCRHAEAQNACDPGLTGSPNSPLGYSMRGDRCEGIYARQVNSTDLRVASLVESFSFDLEKGTSLTVQWPIIEGHAEVIRLRALSLRPQSYYRMDTLVRTATGRYAWPTEILGALDLRRDEVGVLAWYQLELGTAGYQVHLPLRVFQDSSEAHASAYEIAVIPDIRLREIFMTLTPMDSRGVEGEPVITKKPLDHGYYPAKQATVFNLPKPASSGIYRLDLTCDRMPSGVATTSLWFYHSG